MSTRLPKTALSTHTLKCKAAGWPQPSGQGPLDTARLGQQGFHQEGQQQHRSDSTTETIWQLTHCRK